MHLQIWHYLLSRARLGLPIEKRLSSLKSATNIKSSAVCRNANRGWDASCISSRQSIALNQALQNGLLTSVRMALSSDFLSKRPGQQAQLNIAQVMFSPTLQLRDLQSLERYFEYYKRELRLLNLGRMPHGVPRKEQAVQTHADILLVVEFLRENTRLTKRQARDQIKQSKVRFSDADEDALESSIDLSLRLWMMLNIREYELRLQTPQTPSLVWGEKELFENFLGNTFQCSKGSIEAKDSRLDPSFTAAFMVDICGLRLEWTDCLADHLRLDRRQKILRVFPYKSFLRNHLDHKQSHLPITVLKETIWSLNLLFPQWDPPTIKLLKQNKQDFQDSGPYDGPRTLNLTEFDHWRDRLQEVYDVVFRSPPVSWAQLWKDRRNPQQFWTFWIALFILALTLVSTVTSIVQAWASVKSLHLT